VEKGGLFSYKDQPMSANKRTVEKYMEGFRKSDHAAVLACLADDVEWVIPGMFHVRGKAAFNEQIENDAFVGSPTITITRLTEENDVVAAEGKVSCARKDGGVLNAVFCDIFVLQDAKIKHLTSYLMEAKQ
jgi:ketosteroid isomerase-like protein